MKCVIMAGGRGTRIQSVEADLPKPMIQICGKPVLEWQIETFRKQGIKEFILTVSYMADVIIEYFGDGSQMGVHIDYYVEKTPLGNAGALIKIPELKKDDFLLINADLIFDIDIRRFVEYHKRKKGLVTLFTHPNSHPYDSGLLITDENQSVLQWLTSEDDRPEWYHNRVNAGIHLISPLLMEEIEKRIDSEKIDLDRDVLKPLCGTGRMFCYDSPEYVKDMGTPERLISVKRDISEGIVSSRNLIRLQKAVFLDRDGTINQYVGFLRHIGEFTLLPDVGEAIKRLNAAGFLVIVVTNQPVIARGEVTKLELEQIHKKMETLLGREGAYLDAIYYCPHHPDKGYPGEVADLKMICECRKPNPGMLLQAARDYHIDLQNSWMVGDGEADILAGKRAGCHTAFIGDKNYGQNMTVTGLKDFTERILECN